MRMVGGCAEKLLFLFLWIFSFLCWTCFSQRQVVPAIYVLGDSLVDVGNNNYLNLSPLKANFPHNGVDFTDGKATGRFSNGKNAADFIAEKVGLPTSPPYLSLNSSPNKSNAFLNGVSFASGGAGILDGSDQSLSMNKQIEYYSIVYADIVQQLGSVKAQIHLSKSLFGIVIGSNDLLGYFKPRSSRRSNNTPQQYIDMLLSTLKSQVKSICNLGARKLVFIGAGAVGCCPSQRLQNQTRECNQETNYWSLKYNEGVKRILQGMKSDFPDMNYSFFNTYSVLLDLIQNPANSGFTEVKGACCGLGDLRARIPCLPISRYCSNRKEHVFWDLYHPTERAAQIFANLIFDGPKKYVEPLNLKELVSL